MKIHSNIIILYSLLLFHGNSNAFFWDSKIEVLCIDSNSSVQLVYTYEMKGGEIFETLILPKIRNKVKGTDVLISLTKLDDCVVKDSKNWVCGGKDSSFIRPEGNLLLNVRQTSEQHSSLEGKYAFTPASQNSIVLPDPFCKKRIQSN